MTTEMSKYNHPKVSAVNEKDKVDALKLGDENNKIFWPARRGI